MSEVMTADAHRVTRFWTVAAIYAALTIALTYPLSTQPASTIAWSDADTDLFMWTLAWDTHAFISQPLRIFDANIYFPYAHTLAYSENLIGSAFFAAPVLWLTGNPVLALNVVALLSVLLCGVGAYVLAQRLGLGPGSAFVCGLVFAFAPARFFRITQMHLTTVQWIPFALAYLHAYLDRGRRRDLRLAAAFLSLQILASGHGAVFLLVAAGLLLVYRVALGEPIAPARRLRDLGWSGVALLAPGLLIVLPYRAVQVEMGLRRTLGDTAPSPESFLASPTHVQTFLLSFFPDAHVMERASALLFPGFLTVLLAILVFVRDRATLRREWIFYALLTVVSVLLAAGPLWTYVYWLPGFNFIRGPSRFMILAMVGLSVLAAIGFDRIRSVRAAAIPAGARRDRLGAAHRRVHRDPVPHGAVRGEASIGRPMARRPAEAVRGRRGPCAAARSLSDRLHAALDGALAEDRPRLQRHAPAAARPPVLGAAPISRTTSASPASPSWASPTSSCTSANTTRPANGKRWSGGLPATEIA